MSANTIITSIVTGGTNTHTTTAEEANAVRTDFGTAGVIGAITLNTGSGGTGAYCVNQNTGSNLAINILAGTAQYALTPSGQGSQMVRATAAADYTAYTINSNSTGSTKYDWIYLKGDATKGNNPASAADDVTAIYTSRSSSNTTDNGTPPTYGLLLAVVTVANGATAITNSNISDKRYNASLGAQNGSLIVNQNGTGTDATIQSAGIDANVNLKLQPKGTGVVEIGENGSSLSQISAVGSDTNISLNLVPKGTGTIQFAGNTVTPGAWSSWTPVWTGVTVGNATNVGKTMQIGKTVFFEFEFTTGSTTSYTGSLYVNFPSTAVTYLQFHRLGFSQVMNVAGGAIYNGSIGWDTTGRMIILNDLVASTNVKSQGVSSGTPISLPTGTIIVGHGYYEIA